MLIAMLVQAFRGFCMGTADVVPGVSGGTIAIVLGIYERLVANVRTGAGALARLLRLDGPNAWRELKRIEWTFIVPLLAGIGAAILLLASALDHLLDEQPVEMSAIFFGLVAASVVVVWDRIQKRDGFRLIVLGLVAIITFFVLGYRGDELTDPEWWFIIVSGSIAICAMILPGISGSFILLILGVYEYVIEAVDERDLAVVALFGVGAVAGLALFSPVLNWGLQRYHDTMMALLTGIMLGSLRVLWPWPEGADNAGLASPPAAGDLVVPAVLAIGGAAIVLALVRLDRASRAGSRA